MAAEEEHVELFTTALTKMGAATSDFGYNLFRSLATREPAANIFLAPISVSAGLTQLSLGNTYLQYVFSTENPLVSWQNCVLFHSSNESLGGSELAQRQLHRALRYHTLQDPQLHNTLKDLLASIKAPGKGLGLAARLYLARRESVLVAFQQAKIWQPFNIAVFLQVFV